MSSWLGGLVILATIVLPQAATPVSALAGWSKQATVTVVVLVATGVTQSARELGGLSGVLDTTYGRLLVAKVLLVAVTLLIASRSRAVVVVPAAADDDPTAAPADRRGLLRRAVLFEVAVLVVVVALTSALVETAPAKSISSGPAELTLTQDGLTADIIVDPARKGANELHLTFSFPSGSLTPITQVSVNLTLPERSLGPIAVPVDIAGPNHFIANLVDIPIAGTWQVEVLARRSEFSETRFAGAVIVR
jgi:copper transport protein